MFCCSLSAKEFLERVLGLKDVQVIPCSIDPNRFRPLPKTMQIAMVVRKLPDRASFISGVFFAKYPDARKVPFVVINNEHENKVAEILGRSAILLSLSSRESFGLVSVEAMAAGCLVAGYHGHGSLEYASAENGLWFGADEAEEIADALYRSVKGIEQDAPWVKKMLEDSAKVVKKYNRTATRDVLGAYFARYTTAQGQTQQSKVSS